MLGEPGDMASIDCSQFSENGYFEGWILSMITRSHETPFRYQAAEKRCLSPRSPGRRDTMIPVSQLSRRASHERSAQPSVHHARIRQPRRACPLNHPLRIIKCVADDVLDHTTGDYDRMYSKIGRASVPPERLLKALLLISLYSIRSERAFCQELDYNLLYRWFLDMDLMEPSFDATVFTKNRRRLLPHKVGRKLFEEVAYEADRRGLMSYEHFSVDGTLIEAAASIKSFRRRDDDDESKGE